MEANISNIYYREHVFNLVLADNEAQADAERDRLGKVSFLESLRKEYV